MAEFEVRPRKSFVLLALLGACGFVVGGLFILLRADSGIPTRAVGALGVVFFGWCGFAAVQHLSTAPLLKFTADGLWFGSRTFSPKLIRWVDVSGIGEYVVHNQTLNVIALRDTEYFLSQFDEVEARKTLRSMRAMLALAGVTAVVALANLRTADAVNLSNLAKSAIGSGLSSCYASMRDHYGGEIQLGWPQRDRDAAAFGELLRVWVARYGDGGAR
ncbi:MAG: STM3941 family protein [Pseudomonadota bacterium]